LQLIVESGTWQPNHLEQDRQWKMRP
jgi:hypothetical protein